MKLTAEERKDIIHHAGERIMNVMKSACELATDEQDQVAIATGCMTAAAIGVGVYLLKIFREDIDNKDNHNKVMPAVLSLLNRSTCKDSEVEAIILSKMIVDPWYSRDK